MEIELTTYQDFKVGSHIELDISYGPKVKCPAELLPHDPESYFAVPIIDDNEVKLFCVKDFKNGDCIIFKKTSKLCKDKLALILLNSRSNFVCAEKQDEDKWILYWQDNTDRNPEIVNEKDIIVLGEYHLNFSKINVKK